MIRTELSVVTHLWQLIEVQRFYIRAIVIIESILNYNFPEILYTILLSITLDKKSITNIIKITTNYKSSPAGLQWLKKDTKENCHGCVTIDHGDSARNLILRSYNSYKILLNNVFSIILFYERSDRLFVTLVYHFDKRRKVLEKYSCECRSHNTDPFLIPIFFFFFLQNITEKQ